MSKYHYVYLLIDDDADMFYIGKRSSCCKSDEDVKYMSSSKYVPKDRCDKIVLKEFATAKEAVAYEIELHNRFDVAKNAKFYNRAKQTSIGWDVSGVKLPSQSDETKAKRLASRSWYKHHSEETRAKISKAHKGKIVTEETRKAISIGRKGVQSRLGVPHTEEVKRKIGDAKRGQKHTEESKIKMSKSSSIPIEQIDVSTGEVINSFPSATVAAECIGGNTSPITAVCKGRWKTYHGFAWRYKIQEENNK